MFSTPAKWESRQKIEPDFQYVYSTLQGEAVNTSHKK